MEQEQNNIEEISLIYLLLDKLYYSKYIHFLNKLNLEIETKNLLNCITSYFKDNPLIDKISVEELFLYFSVKHPTLKKKESYQLFLKKLEEVVIHSDVLEENINKFLERYIVSEMFIPITEVLDGDRYDVIPEIQEAINKYHDMKVQLGKNEDELFVSNGLEDILQATSSSDGLRWRLDCLNKDIGTLNGCSLSHVFARVDTGKTSFLASEITNFASQLKDDQVILWFNNEEEGKKVKKRLYTAALNCTTTNLTEHTSEAQAEFDKLGCNRIKIVDESVLSIEYMDSLISKFNVALVIVDQGDKVHFAGDTKFNDVSKLKQVYGKFRQLAKTHNLPIITVGQASINAYGEKFLELGHMDNSKTGKPAELDFAIGIGKWIEDIEADIDTLRYLSICKNKMAEGKHGRHTVRFDALTARYSNP